MKWGKRWGELKKEKGFRAFSFWGGEVNAGDFPLGPRQTIRKIRGQIIPCNSCKNRPNCAMYQSFTRHRLHGEYSQGTNILHMCTIYIREKQPHDYKDHKV